MVSAAVGLPDAFNVDHDNNLYIKQPVDMIYLQTGLYVEIESMSQVLRRSK